MIIYWCIYIRLLASVSFTLQVPKALATSGQSPDNKVHGANMGPTWVLSAPDGPHVGPMNLAIRVILKNDIWLTNTLEKTCETVWSAMWLWLLMTQYHLVQWHLQAQWCAGSFCSIFGSVREITKSSSTFSATNIRSNMIWLFQLHDKIKMKSNHTGIDYNNNDIAIRSHIMTYNSV